MSRGVLFIGGLGPHPDQIDLILHPSDLLCAADSGLDACIKAGCQPQGIIGDMDSLSSSSLLDSFPKNIIKISPRNKDKSDTELGLLWFQDHRVEEILLLGGGEGRLDHSLALRALYDQPSPPPSRWYTAREEITCIETGRFSIQGGMGASCSFFPAGKGPWKIESQGLFWELDALSWEKGDLSLSNRLKNKNAVLTVHAGRFLMIRPLEDALAFS